MGAGGLQGQAEMDEKGSDGELMGLQSVTLTIDRDAELAASKLTEAQRTQVLSAAGLDDQAGSRALDVLEKILMAWALGHGSWASVPMAAQQDLCPLIDIEQLVSSLRDRVSASGYARPEGTFDGPLSTWTWDPGGSKKEGAYFVESSKYGGDNRTRLVILGRTLTCLRF